MAIQTVSGALQTIRDCYVDSSQPNVAIWNEQLIYNNNMTLIPLIAFDNNQFYQIPKYANISFKMTGVYWMYVSGLYALNSTFTSDVTYNTRPQMTLISTHDFSNYGGVTIPIVYETLSSFKYGLSLQGYRNDDYDNQNLGNSSRRGRYIPSIIWEYTLDNETLTFNTTGTSIDNAITVSWTLANQLTGIVKAYQNGNLVTTKSVTSSNTVNFEAGTFKSTVDITFTLEASVQGTLYTSSNVLTGLTKVMPSISSLEPNNINQNVDSNITVSWVSTNQHSYKLEVDGIAYTGTTQNSVIIPGATLTQGLKNIKLTVYYTSSWGELRIVEKVVSFLGYGKPTTPILNLKTIYSTATPILNWVSSGQVAYRIVIKKNSTTVIDTNEVISSNQSYTVSIALENNTTYTVSLLIKNQYNLWSTEAIGTFSTQFTVLPSPSLVATVENGGAIILKLNTNSENATEYKCSEIWRRDTYGEWKRIAYDLGIDTVYRDFYIASEVSYEYKARNIATSGGISESDVIISSAKVRYYTLFDVEDTSKSITFKNDVVITPKYNQNIASNLFAGNEKPTTERGKEGYFDSTISFKTRDRSLITKLINLVRTSKVLLFKDSRGHKWFGNVVGNLEFPETSLGIITITFQFLETNFLEQDVYSGNNSLYLLKFDGTWMFNGAKEFNGVG